MANRPWYPWYPADYRRDTQLLSDDADLLYRRLLDALWENGGVLPMFDRSLAKVSAKQLRNFRRLWPQVSNLFYEKDGKLRHKRIDKELLKVIEISEKRSESARRRSESFAPANAEQLHVDENQQLHQYSHSHSQVNTNPDTYVNTSGTAGIRPEIDRCPYDQIFELYHRLLPGLPVVFKPESATRRKYVKARWREDLPDLQHWENFFTHVAASKFLTGKVSGQQGRPPFLADLAWLCRPENFIKITQGHYHRS